MKASAASRITPLLVAIVALAVIIAFAPAQEPGAPSPEPAITVPAAALEGVGAGEAGTVVESIEGIDSAVVDVPAPPSNKEIDFPRAFTALGVGIVLVLGLIIGAKVNAFIALITAALAVSCIAPGAWPEKISRVTEAFGTHAGKIGIIIAMAAVIGDCMLRSGAADRIVRFFLRLFGDKRSPIALMGSGFVLAVPVFFDTVFYLLVPLARSLHRKTGKDYLKYILAIAAGGAITHTLVPPTPGPLAMAENLGFDVGLMIVIGAIVALPAAIAGLLCAGVMNRLMPIPMRQIGNQEEPEPLPDEELPALFLSILPVALPVLLIASNTIIGSMEKNNLELDAVNQQAWLHQVSTITGLIGNPSLALMFSAVVAMCMVVVKRGTSLRELGKLTETSLLSGGLIILITAGGGAFGDMLKAARVGAAIEALFKADGASTASAGMTMLLLGFGIAAVLKIAQGSSTVAMITVSGMLFSAGLGDKLGFHPVYLATAIGAGSLIGSWMNDSGFWIFSKMGGLTEVEALKTWTVLLLVLGSVSFGTTVLLANVLPNPLALFGAG